MTLSLAITGMLGSCDSVALADSTATLDRLGKLGLTRRTRSVGKSEWCQETCFRPTRLPAARGKVWQLIEDFSGCLTICETSVVPIDELGANPSELTPTEDDMRTSGASPSDFILGRRAGMIVMVGIWLDPWPLVECTDDDDSATEMSVHRVDWRSFELLLSLLPDPELRC